MDTSKVTEKAAPGITEREFVQVDINEAIAKANENQKLVQVLEGVDITLMADKKDSFATAMKMNMCSSTVTVCRLPVLKGFEFCHKHILEDKTSPYQYCCFRSKGDGKKCRNPAPKLGGQKSFCLYHEKQKNKLKKKKVKESPLGVSKTNQDGISLVCSKQTSSIKRSSSEEEDYSFFTDSVQVDKIACTWLGNQASDADSTDSEDENPLNHAGVWTLEESVRICKEKIERLRFLYMQQFKRLSYCLREDRRKMLNEYDMDPYTLSKVDPTGRTEDAHRDFVEDCLLTNYQKMSGVERLAEKQMREKKNHSHYGKRSELPRCHQNVDGSRCTSRVLPFSKYCHQHICLDQEQNLFEECIHQKQGSDKCKSPAALFSENCHLHVPLEQSKSERLLSGIAIAKKAKEAKKRKLEQAKAEKKDEIKKEVVYHNTRRASKNREENLKSPTVSDILSTVQGPEFPVKTRSHEMDVKPEICQSPVKSHAPQSVKVSQSSESISSNTGLNESQVQSQNNIRYIEIPSKVQVLENSDNSFQCTGKTVGEIVGEENIVKLSKDVGKTVFEKSDDFEKGRDVLAVEMDVSVADEKPTDTTGGMSLMEE